MSGPERLLMSVLLMSVSTVVRYSNSLIDTCYHSFEMQKNAMDLHPLYTVFGSAAFVLQIVFILLNTVQMFADSLSEGLFSSQELLRNLLQQVLYCQPDIVIVDWFQF